MLAYKTAGGIQLSESFQDIYQTIKSVAPIVGRALRTGQIFRPRCDLTEADPDILCEYDVAVPMSEGYSLTANVFRSRSSDRDGTRVPVVMCAHPYDNHKLPALGKTPFGGAPQQYRLIPQSGGRPTFSKLTSWESPDPNFWVAAGYAVVNLNLPGYANSGGPPTAFSEHQAKCYYEAIEWIAARDWCTGAVGLNGVSFLAITQFHVAACQHYGGPPPALRCISPWEGLTDTYRDIFMNGGIKEIGFPAFWWNTEVKGTINGDPARFIAAEGAKPTEFDREHPFYDDMWREKTAKLDEITVPMLVCASFSDHGLHTMGSFRAFERARSRHKWVYTHRTGKWVAYYSDEVQRLTRDFMDCFCKDDSTNGMLDIPPVRLEVRSTRDEIHAVRHEHEWPLARTQYKKLFLDTQALSLVPPVHAREHVYAARDGRATWNHIFQADTELSGYMKLRLWVEARAAKSTANPPDDMAIFVAVNKLDRAGQSVPFYGSVGSSHDMITRGCLRVSRRELDPDRSTDYHPVLKGTSEHKLTPGQIVPVDIELYPSATFFAAGEAIQLIVSANEIIPSPPYRRVVDYNRGLHVFHFGGEYDAFLQVPEV